MTAIQTTGWPFCTFHHVHVIVDDMEHTQSYLNSIGIPIYDYPWRGGWTELRGLDEETFKELGYKRALIGNVHFQFMSPGQRDSPHKQIAAEFGQRVYSIGFLVSNVDAAEEELIRRGLTVLMRGRRSDGFGFTYFNTADKLGINLCIRQNARDMVNGP
jgi:hypothetical protein